MIASTVVEKLSQWVEAQGLTGAVKFSWDNVTTEDHQLLHQVRVLWADQTIAEEYVSFGCGSDTVRRLKNPQETGDDPWPRNHS